MRFPLFQRGSTTVRRSPLLLLLEFKSKSDGAGGPGSLFFAIALFRAPCDRLGGRQTDHEDADADVDVDGR